MKKIVILIVIVIAIFLIVILKNIMTTKYSHNDIVNLLNKGMQRMDNISFDRENDNGVVTYYFKDDKSKMVSESDGLVCIEKSEKSYIINKKRKGMYINKQEYTLNKGLQNQALIIERANEGLNERNNSEDNFRYKYIYIRNEKIENKDCIFVKEAKYYLDTKKYTDNMDYKNEIPVYWIEKSTGIVIGAGFMEPGKNKATPQAIIKNIKYGEVTDDMFNDILNIPNDYRILERKENGEVELLSK